MMTQTDKILAALKENPDGLHPTYFIVQLHIFQYSARIHELRTRFGCTCKNGNDICFATEHIRNFDRPDGTTLFKYYLDNTHKWEKMRQETIAKRDENKQSSLFG